jgi:hypothetical protein
MIVISDSTSEVDLPIDLFSRIQERMACITQDEPSDPDLHGLIAVIKAGDSLDAISSAVCSDIFANTVSGVRSASPALSPPSRCLRSPRLIH